MKRLAPLVLISLFLLLTSGCLPQANFSVDTLVNIHEAENIHFSSDNRLFVTGGRGLYEIISKDKSYSALQLKAQCSATGMAELQGWLFFPCTNLFEPNELWAYQLSTGNLHNLGTLENYALANGMAALGETTLFLSNTDFFNGQGSIGKLTLDFSAATPELVAIDSHWASAAEGLSSPNGLRLSGTRLYLSNNSALKTIELDDDANILSVNTLSAPNTAYYDDLEVEYAGGLLVTSFVEGVIYKISDNCVSKTAAAFLGPSAVRLGQGAFSGKILVTQRIGHKLSVIDVTVFDELNCL